MRKQFKYGAVLESITGKSQKGNYQSITVRGVAAQSITSRNGVTYEPKELKAAVASLEGKPIGLDHNGQAMDIVGKIAKAWFDESTNQVLFEAEIMNTDRNPGVVEMIENKLIQSVSIEAIFREIDRKDGRYIARGMEFLGFDLVKTPGHPKASVSLAESLNSLFFNPISNMDAFKKALENISKKAVLHKDDISLMESLLPFVGDDQKESCQKDIDGLSERLKGQRAPAAGAHFTESQVSEMIAEHTKDLVKGLSDMKAVVESSKKAAEDAKKAQEKVLIEKKVKESLIIDSNRSTGFTKANESLVVAFVESLDSALQEKFFELMKKVATAKMGREGAGGSYIEEGTDEEVRAQIAVEAQKYAQDTGKTPKEVAELFSKKRKELMESKGLKD